MMKAAPPLAPRPEVALTPCPREELRALVSRSGLAASLTIAVDWGFVAAAVWMSLSFPSPWVYFASVVVISRQMNALYELHHHAIHANLFRRKKLNEALEFLYSLPLFLRVADDRESHMEHHSTFSVETRDYATWGTGYGLDPARRGNRRYMIWFLLVRPFLGPVQLDALTGIVRSKSWRDSGYRRAVLGFWAVVGGALTAAGHVELLFWYWVIPYFTVYPVLFFWDDMMAHYNCPKTGTREMRGVYFALMSTHGTNYHNIHHAYPAIPWFRMRRASGMCVNERAVDAAHGFVDGMQQMIELAE